MKAAYLADADKIAKLGDKIKAEQLADKHRKKIQLAEFEKQLALAVSKAAKHSTDSAHAQYNTEKKAYLAKIAK